MPKFRKKPVVIEAVQLVDVTERCGLEPDWLGQIRMYTDGHAEIATLEGTMRANIGDWIIKGVKGELYPCKPDIFAETYEQVD